MCCELHGWFGTEHSGVRFAIVIMYKIIYALSEVLGCFKNLKITLILMKVAPKAEFTYCKAYIFLVFY